VIVALLCCLSAILVWRTNSLRIPRGMEPLAKSLHNAIDCLALPAQLVAERFWPMRSHHLPWPAIIVPALVAPLIWYPIGRWLLVAPRLTRTTQGEESSLTATESVSRRRFLSRSGTGLVCAVAGLGAYTTVVEPSRLLVRRYKLGIRNLPAALDGIRFAHMSDTHYGPYVSLPHIRRAVKLVRQQRCDLVVLTGDYVHRTPQAIHDGIGVLEECRGALGAVAVLGNHDHWEDTAACVERFEQIGLPLLDHRRRYLTKSGLVMSEPAPADSIVIAGMGDLWEDPQTFADILEDVEPTQPRIVLSHNPDTAELPDAGTYRVDLMLSGHTHGGQVWVPGIGSPIVPSSYGERYSGGLCPGPHFRVLVSRGVGMAVMPVRFGVPAEISVIELYAES
jgi:hypothetical protein